MSETDHFVALIKKLPPFAGPFDAYRLNASNCSSLSMALKAGTVQAIGTIY